MQIFPNSSAENWCKIGTRYKSRYAGRSTNQIISRFVWRSYKKEQVDKNISQCRN